MLNRERFVLIYLLVKSFARAPLLTRIGDAVLYVLTSLFMSAAIVSVVLLVTAHSWSPWLQRQVLDICKDYHATQVILEQQKTYTPCGPKDILQ